MLSKIFSVALVKNNILMKNNYFLIIAISVLGILFASCNGNSGNTESSTKDSVKPMPPVALAKVSASPDFPDAALGIKSVKTEKVGNDSTKVIFEFEVKNYELKAQTTDAASKLCNNSDKGQHIHFIMDNMAYKALYEPKNEVTFANGTEHYLMAFLSRSYHESIKSPKASLLYYFNIDKKGTLKNMDMEDPKHPMLFYSRPKGDYFGKDTASVLLDFYVWNCNIAKDGYKVKADIENKDVSGRTLSVILDKWGSNFIQNLGTGKCKVTLTLIDKDGKNVEGAMTTATREFNLAASEPMKK